MKDRIALIAAALILACGAWIFWHYLGEEAFTVLPTLVLIVFAIDNHRLRRRLQQIKAENPSSH